MSYKDRIRETEEKFDMTNWPHQFTHDGAPRKVGEEPLTGDPIMAAPMVCVHCNATYISGMDNRPPDPCPARTRDTEGKRLFS